MRIHGWTTSVVMVAILVMAVPALAQTDRELDEAQTFRRDFALPSSMAVVRDSFADRETYSDMSRGIPLTPVEAAQLDRRRDIVWQSEPAREFARTLDGYADVYIDQGRGGIPVFRFTDDLEAARAAIAEVMPDGVDFDVERAEFTSKQLQAKQERITQDMLETDWLLDGDIRLVSAGASAKANRVLVGLLRAEDEERARAILQDRYGPMVDVEYIGPTEEDERQPTAPASPPDGTETSGLPAGLVTEQVEPGVLRVVSDGHRVLSGERQEGDVFAWGDWLTTHLERTLAAAPDGAVWGFDDTGMFEVGERKTRSLKGEPPVRSYDDVEIAPDGTIWRVGTPRANLRTLHSFNGRKWRRDYLPGVSVFGVELQPNGTAWALWAPPVGADPQGLAPTKLGKWTGKRWKAYDLPRMRASYGGQFAVTGKDDVWICCKERPWTEQQRLLHFDGTSFDLVDDPAPQAERIVAPLLIDGSSDGTLWMRRSESTLARHDDDGWTVYTADDGVPQMGWMPEPTGGFLRAAPDGSVWVSTTLDRGEPPDDWPPACDGVAHFDGTTWTPFLAGRCVFALDVAPDGRAWVQAALPDTATTAEPVPGEPVEPIQTYIIDPEAVSASADPTEAQPSPSTSE